MWKKWLYVALVLTGWSYLKIQFPARCNSCCVLSERPACAMPGRLPPPCAGAAAEELPQALTVGELVDSAGDSQAATLDGLPRFLVRPVPEISPPNQIQLEPVEPSQRRESRPAGSVQSPPGEFR